MPLTKPLDWQIRNTRVLLSALLIAGWLTACGGGGGGGGAAPITPPAQSYTIGGTVTGLTASGLVLLNNGGDNLTVAANATTFTFATKVAANGAYAVTVMTQPTNETCTVTGGSGTVASSNVTSVSIACTSTNIPTFTVGGTITGYTGAGLVLQNNGGDNYTVPAKATSFTFPTKVATGAAYAVTVLTQPSSPAQTCTVTGGSGTMGSANVTTVSIACANQAFTIGGTVSGLSGTTGVVLQDNGGDNLTVKASGSFTFKTPVSAGATYAVTVLTQPSTPTQTCTVTSGTGTVVASNVTNVAIQCVTSYTIGGTISGLTGAGLVLRDNGGDNLTVAAKATAFTFKTGLTTGTAYAVTVLTQPSHPNQYCTVTNGTGTVASANIANVTVSCINIGRFAFVTNYTGGGGTGDVSAFTIDPKTGALSAVAGSPFTAGNRPYAIAVDGTGLFAYVANQTDVNVTIFGVDQTSGALSATGTASTSGTVGACIVVAPSNKYVYVGGSGNPAGSVFGLVNSPPGTLAPVPSGPFPTGNTPLGIVVDPTNQFVFATASYESHIYGYSINGDGSLTSTTQAVISAGSGPQGLAVYPLGGTNGGFLYTADSGESHVRGFKYDQTGTLTELGSSPFNPFGAQPSGIAIDPQGAYLYVTNYADGTVASFSIDPSSGALTLLSGPLPPMTGNLNHVANPGPLDVKVDPSGQYVYVANYLDGSVSMFSSNAGVLTLVNSWLTDSGSSSIAIE